MVAALEIVAELGGRRYGRGWRAPCLAHADKHPSLDIMSTPRTDFDAPVFVSIEASCSRCEAKNTINLLIGVAQFLILVCCVSVSHLGQKAVKAPALKFSEELISEVTKNVRTISAPMSPREHQGATLPRRRTTFSARMPSV